MRIKHLYILAIFKIKYYFCNMNNKEKPIVSFIITCYNLPTDMLTECIDSILALSLNENEREIILIDDGSQTSPVDALGLRMDEITYIRQNNKGLSVARNVGIDMAMGQYIQFVDGDDMLISHAYEHCLDIVKYDNYDIIMFNPTSNINKKTIIHGKPKICSGEEYMLNNNLHATAWGYIFRKDILDDLRFTPGTLHEDEEFTPQLMLRAKNVYAIGINAYFYRQRPHSITNSTDKRNIIKRLNDIECIIKKLDNLAAAIQGRGQAAMKRRVAQLTMDYIYNTIKLTGSATQFGKRLERLKAQALFPLPDRHYTTKYTLFRIALKSLLVQRLLKNVLKQY